MDVEQALRTDGGTASRTAWWLCGLVLALIACAAVLGTMNATGIDELVFLIAVASSAVVGGVTAARRPANPVGWFFLASAFSFGSNVLTTEYAKYGILTEPGALPATGAMIWLSTWLWVPGSVLVLVFVPLLFPDGRLVCARWRPVVWFAGLFAVLGAVGSALEPGAVPGTAIANPLGTQLPGSVTAVLDVIVLPVWLGLIVVAAASLVVRFRGAGKVARQQIKWLAFAAVLVPFWFLLNAPVERAAPTLFSVLDALALSAVPIAAGVAIVRHRLYDIDLVINRTLVYGALTACVVGLYVLVIGYLGQLFRVAGDLLISLVATGVVAVGFAPLRERLQGVVNRLMYGERDDPYAVVSRLSRRLEATLAPDAVLATIVETVRDALKLPYVAIALGHGNVVAAAGAGIDDPQCIPLVYRNEPIGELLLGTRLGDDDFSAADRRLLDDVARQAGLAVHNLRLTADLQLARERLVTTREEERRRLRRDLHDGLGPMLASLTLKLDVARGLLERDPATARRLLAGLKEQAQFAVTDIRRLVYALRPPPLDDLGLVGAVQEAAAQYDTPELQVSVEVPDEVPELPAAVEVAAYRTVTEALTNVARHARAQRCTVRLAVDADDLVLEIDDDGRGVPAGSRSGVGIGGMRERAEELGGSCVLGRSPTGGTRVRSVLPFTPAAGVNLLAEARR